jgi:putative ABC transport system ATP-binding protein
VVPLGDRQLTILEGVSLDVAAGETLAIVGASGSGKTTLLGLLAGLDRPNSGSVAWHGEAVSSLTEDALAKRRQGAIGFVFQSFQLLPALTALENVMLPLELAGARDAEKRAADWLARVGLGERVDHLRSSSPAASSSASPLREPSSPTRKSSLPMSQPAISILIPAPRSSS